MKQVIQSIKSGVTEVAEVPTAIPKQNQALIHVSHSLVSAGTERMVVDFAEKNLLQKARSRPDLVRQTMEKAQREGILTTFEAVQNRLAQPISLGYSCAGTVIEVGADLPHLKIGDRVACAGGGYAIHAEATVVPKNLMVKLQDGVDFESAAFTTLGAIALQGVRLAELKLGEIAVVIGLGLLGQLTVQLLKAAGCLVLGMDIQPQRAALAQQLGADGVAVTANELQALLQERSGGRGADVVLITADTKSNQPVELAGEAARNNGIVVAVGAVGMSIPRKIYYEKELDFRISRSYGPGRYDSSYEEEGHDYPYSYVRWTEQRNMEAFVQLVAEGKVNVAPLISHRFPIEDAPDAYDLITGKTEQSFLGVLLTYPNQPDLSRKITLQSINRSPANRDGVAQHQLDRVGLGVLGAGNFANNALLPIIKGLPNLDLVGIASGSGLSARSSGDRFGFTYCTTDSNEILSDDSVNTVAVLTRHHLHAPQVIAALQAGKHVFVEKPLCLTSVELQEINTTYQILQSEKQNGPTLMVGFNRRFAPFIVELKDHLADVHEPLMLNFRANAGYIPQNHWTQDLSQGGGRLLGEACHFIDLLIYLAGNSVQQITAQALPDRGRYSQDNLLITMTFSNGSLATLSYLANGDKSFGKEYLEVFGGGLAARMDDYRTLSIRHGQKRIKRTARLRQDKGHQAEWQALIAHLTGAEAAPIPFTQVISSTQATLAAQQSLQRGEAVVLTER